MKRIESYLISFLLVVTSTCSFPYRASAFEPDVALPGFEILVPGTSRTINIVQNDNYPQEMSQFLVMLIGYGIASITVRKTDMEGDLLVLSGFGISSEGFFPFYKFGKTSVTLTESVEIGSERSPCGLLWIGSWVESQANEFPYSYSLILAF
jgi:hypothetical protein